ncbi:DNA polymerase IV [Azospirillum sp. SYSU D00513]|uniref:DNA polymerase IV n=1 Tax=Azospirillum sp. SYSU D00513 TaxID=2812561 RepID=UPI001FFEC0A0|nr:DNA polymerase IV [Azospirillum sp. SYSU D00513]
MSGMESTPLSVSDMALPSGGGSVCRDCAAGYSSTVQRCPKCGSRRVKSHPELHALNIGHLDFDSFYPSVEKRDRPELVDKPVIVGGGARGVVASCCYIARMSGVRSAMPTHEALARCPEAVVIPPDMAKYKEVGYRAREIMRAYTPLVEPLSLDEAYVDLNDVRQQLHISPAQAMVEITRRFETELSITASIGLSYNKFLAKVSSDLDKPRGMAVIGRAEALAFLAPKRPTILWGVGPAMERRLHDDGIRTVADIMELEEITLVRRYGAMGRTLFRYAHGRDDRRVEPESPSKSVSAEDTLDWPTADFATLAAEARRLAVRVEQRMSREWVLGRSVTLKLKTADFQLLTRSRRVDPATRSAEQIVDMVMPLLERECDGREFRLIGVGCSDLVEPGAEPDLFG